MGPSPSRQFNRPSEPAMRQTLIALALLMSAGAAFAQHNHVPPASTYAGMQRREI